ncbi:sigma-54 dependent transcriptional regulator [Altererythrobacter sp.]|uniref:sigma-54-dependent transcriptional regulator n=1 Tax=Altererythrobacter sp. TaxID=1872480 RepID=UPI001AFEBFE5|nr:sigma-54 dependent transcriptional regulator [Altererythrobacter sp.]MBO6608522.1 sigma-54-dependent Fis family transcriptional regulator [Altererythrobacter sp.]MBO6641963.1 sigma-54-dependent Fis family transcriptional regulator [Altererythrobacter sp.]MBO6709529.1 sigma-54-dependent Fis family transcriptional regulator [Altererythrobacter sp.]MBO6944364.1 sigma-54-dependent Fis family transcriptional regulator [Altererythrobacter sp.]
MMPSAKVLIVEDSASLALGYAAQLEDAGHEVSLCETLNEARRSLCSETIDVVLLDLQLPDGDGLTLFEALPTSKSQPSVIVVTADGSLNRAIAAMRRGAYDFLVKPVSGTRLLSTVSNAAEQTGRLEVEAIPPSAVEGDEETFHGFIGKSPVMKAVFRTIKSVADSKATVFVTGESGTGKEVTAEAIHSASKRRGGPFVAINCGAIPENLLESELFGHVKGAFTGAIENRIGAAKAADGGTLFLDEICEMDLKLQVKLLRFLQTGMIQRVGSSAAELVNVRIVCATNRNPEREVAEGRFREDLYYRLNVIPISLPALRERGDDIALIASSLAQRIANEEGRKFSGFTKASETYLQRHDWPGNVRELQNSLRRAIITGSGGKVELASATQPVARATFVSHRTVVTADESFSPSPAQGSESAAVADFTGMTLEQIERLAIEQAIARSSGNIVQAARDLGVSPSTIYRKLDRWSA